MKVRSRSLRAAQSSRSNNSTSLKPLMASELEDWNARAAEAVELAAVGGQCQFVQAVAQMAGHAVEEGHDALADERFAPGDAKLSDAQTNEGRAHAVQLFQCQQILFGQEGHVLRHAIGAAEVAAVGDRDPQIVDGPREGVDQFGGQCGRICRCHARNATRPRPPRQVGLTERCGALG